MKKNNKRFLAFVLAAAMVLTYMPSTMYAFAEEGAEEAASSAPKAAAAEEVKSEPEPAPKAEEQPAPAAEEKSEPEPASAAQEGTDSAPASEEAAPAAEETKDTVAEESAPAEADNPEAVTEEQDAEALKVEEPEDAEEEPEYPAQHFSGSANGVSVTVSAPEGALPEGTSMKVSGVSESAVADKAQSVVDGEISQIKAVDISFRADGKEIEPKKAVSVHMNASGVAEGDKEVVHIADNGSANSVGASVSDSGSTSFSAKDFSIYAIVITSAPGSWNYERDLDWENRWAIKIRYEDENGSALPGQSGEITLTDGDSITVESIIGQYKTIEVGGDVYNFENAYFYFDRHYGGRKVYVTSFISYAQLNAYGDHLSYSGTLHNTDGSVETNTWIYNNTGVLHLVYTKQDKVLHKVTYHSNIPEGTDEVVSNNWPEGSRIVALSYSQAFGEEPEGYSFLGWAETAEASSPKYGAGATVTSSLSGDKELYAVWEKHPEQMVRINYRSDSTAFGTVSSATDTFDAKWVSSKYKYDFSSISGSTATPAEDYAFDGWYNEVGVLVSNNPVLDPDTVRSHLKSTADSSYEGGVKYSETTFIAKFAELHTVTFVDNDGTVFSTKKYKTGTPASDIEQPTVSHKIIDGEECEFAGWTPEIEEVTEDAVYTATYKEVGKYVVTYHTNFGPEMDQTKEYEQSIGTAHQINTTYDSVFGAPPSGFTFRGWGRTRNSTRPVSGSVRDATDLYAIWDLGSFGVKIIYNAETGGTVAPDLEAISLHIKPDYSGVYYDEPKGPAVHPADGYELEGWYKDGEKISDVNLTPAVILANMNSGEVFGIKFYFDTTFTAKFKPATYKVIYIIEGDSPAGYVAPTDSNDYLRGAEVTVAADASTTETTKDGVPGTWTFNGWTAPEGVTVEGGKFAMPAQDVEITGSWTFAANRYTVTFDSKGGSSVDPQSVTHGEKATQPAAPTRDHYAFEGWYTDEELTKQYEFDTPVTADITLYAKWRQTEAKYTVHHELKGSMPEGGEATGGIPVADDESDYLPIGTPFTATAAASEKYTRFVEGFELDAEIPDTITIKASETENIVTVYYTLPITISAASKVKTYDGSSLDGEATIEKLFTDERFKFVNSDVRAAVKEVTPSITDAGEKTYFSAEDQNKIKAELPEYYVPSFESGTLTIDPRPIKIITAGDEKTYDGTPLTETVNVSISTTVNDGKGLKPFYDAITDFTVTGSQTDAGSSDNTYEISWKEGADSKNFDITDTIGTLTVNPKATTITTGSGSKKYDGTALTNSEASITGLVNGETATVTATGTQTEVGSTKNTYSIDWGKTKSANYTIRENLGTLTVTEADPVPTPTPTPTPDDGGDNPGGGGGTPAATTTTATTPAATPAAAAPAAVITDDPIPQAEPEEINDDPVPMAAPEGTWALLNLIATALTTVGAAITLFRKKEDDDEAEAAKKPEDKDEDDSRGRNMAVAKVLGVAAAAASVITFILTEDMSLPMAMTDKWTLLMGVLFAAQIGTAVACKKASEAEEEEDEEVTEA